MTNNSLGKLCGSKINLLHQTCVSTLENRDGLITKQNIEHTKTVCINQQSSSFQMISKRICFISNDLSTDMDQLEAKLCYMICASNFPDNIKYGKCRISQRFTIEVL